MNITIINEINSTNTQKELSPEEQDAAFFLRERFLYLISSLSGKSSTIIMHDHTEVSANLGIFDSTFENLLINNLKPHKNEFATISKAILRTSDILTIQYSGM